MNVTPSATMTSSPLHHDPHMEVVGPLEPRFGEILTPGALDFLALLHDRFEHTRRDLLARRQEVRIDVENGKDPQFLPETAFMRADPNWRVAPPAPGLEDRRVEITGPTDRKMAINALNSGARVWLADQEDATSPTWQNVIGGQLSLFDHLRGQLDYTSPEGKSYAVTAKRTPTIVMRPRGLHMTEKHLMFTNRIGHQVKASGSLVDFGLYFFHNAQRLIDSGRGPYFYLPKLESHLEARLWNDIFDLAQSRLGIPHGTIRATVLIETLPAAFEMEEILYELRDHCSGLNAGRWDYIFSFIKTFRARGRQWVTPDRKSITMTVPFMRAYTELLVATCHKRGAMAIGGMSAFIPSRKDPEVTERALEQVAADKQREASDGFDGTWVAHPDLIPTAQAQFDAVLGERPNQLDRLRSDVLVTAEQLLDLPSIEGAVTDEGVRSNVAIALRYIDSWLRGTGAAAIDNLMEDVATAEISRSQLWQWWNSHVETVEGNRVTRARISELIDECAAEFEAPGSRFTEAAEILREVSLHEEFPTFLTLGAYARYLD